MFGIGETELVIIVVFAFLLFGPDKLPGMGRTLGRVLRQFREASDGFTEVVQTNIMDPASEELEKSPKQRRREAQQFEEDADIEATQARDDDEPAPRRETFAERKARLAAERAAAVEASAAEDVEDDGGDGEQFSAADVNSDDDLPDEAPAEPARVRAADLFAPNQRSSRSRAAQAAESDEDAEPAREDIATDAAQEPGEEDGSAEA